MPQLDRTIVFTQFFWLFIVFVILYGLLSHYFLPTFLKSLKARSLIIEQNQIENESIKQLFLSKQSVLNKTLNEGLSSIKFMFFNNFVLLNTGKNPLLDLCKIDTYVFNSIFFTSLYCSSITLNNIFLTPKTYNFICTAN
uniref:ATP synthase F0 subunit 8 n=1 Tax=Kumanoa mahlacensis TaxID=1196387 RepID=A0A343UXX3_9FLOR|nr:ATP synthase F0 subunit 8 [Kumanoa mahlacensis]AVK39530.1 ATP synthase F0 subunit 8 [Kumanoa mahlacensis]UEQ11846.1 ATP synthase F0 subunit 8 [Kumanoa mahlacensis]